MTSAQEMGPPTGILCKWYVCLIFLCSDHIQMGIYAALGAAQAVAAFMMGSTFAMLTYFASQQLHRVSISQFQI